jgi:pimeloyl-ACP methyl ester carboxylesterase
MDDAESWKPTADFLDLQKFSFAFMDVRGYGRSKALKGKFDSDEIASDVFNLADKLGWDKFFLIGHSMCGLAAQKAALLDKESRIIKVILITPVSSAGFPVDNKTKEYFQSIVQNEEVARSAFGVFTENRLSENWKRNRARRHVMVTDALAQRMYIDMWTGENFSLEMKSVNKPFLVLAGRHDHPLFQLETQKNQFSHFRNVEFLEIENAGHFPMQEVPVFLATKIEEFFG